jgi:hypothetical protein
MPWIHIGESALIGGIVTSLTDWLFAGDWLSPFYNKHPEVWRFVGGKGEGVAIAWSSPMPFVTCAVFAFLYARLGLRTMMAPLKLAVALWVMIPLPLIVTNALFIKLHPVVTLSHVTGWLAKLIIAGLVSAWLLG